MNTETSPTICLNVSRLNSTERLTGSLIKHYSLETLKHKYNSLQKYDQGRIWIVSKSSGQWTYWLVQFYSCCHPDIKFKTIKLHKNFPSGLLQSNQQNLNTSQKHMICFSLLGSFSFVLPNKLATLRKVGREVCEHESRFASALLHTRFLLWSQSGSHSAVQGSF